jgi:uncharacterized DUF497 family protein
LFVIYTRRGNNRRLIGARKAESHERESHYTHIAAGNTNDEG